MAHRGRPFPVHFRRDFNRNCSIASGGAFPRIWDVTLHSGVVPGYIVDGERFFPQEIAGPTPDTISWLSPARQLGIWLWQLRLNVQFWKLPDSQLQSTWFLERDAIVVSSWRRITFDYEQPVVGGSPFFGQVLFTDFTTFERGANFNFSRTVALGYPP